MIAATEPSLSLLCDNKPVLVHTRDRPDPGRVIQPAETPRSCFVETPLSTIQRNHSHLSRCPETQNMPPQKPNKDISLPLTHKHEHILVHPPDACTGKGEMWHTGSHISQSECTTLKGARTVQRSNVALEITMNINSLSTSQAKTGRLHCTGIV